jgi:hypothetical protein
VAEKHWVIIGATNPDPVSDTFDVVYHGNDGWMDNVGDAQIFDDEEKQFCSLPRGGQWLEIGSILNAD